MRRLKRELRNLIVSCTVIALMFNMMGTASYAERAIGDGMIYMGGLYGSTPDNALLDILIDETDAVDWYYDSEGEHWFVLLEADDSSFSFLPVLANDMAFVAADYPTVNVSNVNGGVVNTLLGTHITPGMMVEVTIPDGEAFLEYEIAIQDPFNDNIDRHQIFVGRLGLPPVGVVTFDDPVLEALLLSNPEYNTDGDDVLSFDEAQLVDEIIYPYPDGSAEQPYITDLTGLEWCVNLNYLDLSGNPLSDYDNLYYTEFPELGIVFLDDTGIHEIDFIENMSNLFALHVSGNLIQWLPYLEFIDGDLMEGPIEEPIEGPFEGGIGSGPVIMDISNNMLVDIEGIETFSMLQELNMSYNDIRDIRPLLSLPFLIELDLTGNPLNEDGDYVGEVLGWDVYEGEFEEYIYFEDWRLEDKLIELGVDNGDGIISFDDAASIDALDLSDYQITSLSGLEHFENLEMLDASANFIVSLAEVRQLTALTHLDLSDNLIRNISPLRDLTLLEALDLTDNPMYDAETAGASFEGEILGWDIYTLNGIMFSSLVEEALLQQGADIDGDGMIDVNEAAFVTVLYIYGDNISTSLSGIDSLVNLQVLSLENCSDIMVSEFGMLPNLSNLSVWGGDINDPLALAELTGLTTLEIRGASLEDISGLASLTNLLYLDLYGNDIEDIGVLGGLTQLQSLNLGENAIQEVGSLGSLASLFYLKLSDNDIVAVDGLSNLIHLQYLDLQNNSITSVLPISNLPNLMSLYVGGNPVGDLHVLTALPILNDLGLDRMGITDLNVLSPFSLMPSLWALSLDGNGITDIGPMGQFTNIGDLSLNHNSVSDLTPLSDLTSLNILSAESNLIEDISPLMGLYNLGVLNLNDNPLLSEDDGAAYIGEILGWDVYVLDGSAYAELDENGNIIFPDANLERALLERFPAVDTDGDGMISVTEAEAVQALDLSLPVLGYSITDIRGLEYFTDLQYLDLSWQRINNWYILEELSGLTDLKLESCNIQDISFLRHMTWLHTLNLTNNNIFNINYLSSMTNLHTLYISGNGVQELGALSGLTGLVYLDLSNNGISDISFLSGLTNLVTLNLSGNTVMNISHLGSLTSLVNLNLNYNGSISGFGTIGGLVNLQSLSLNGVGLTNIDFVGTLSRLTQLDIGYNHLTDISMLLSLPNIDVLTLDGNNLIDPSNTEGAQLIGTINGQPIYSDFRIVCNIENGDVIDGTVGLNFSVEGYTLPNEVFAYAMTFDRYEEVVAGETFEPGVYWMQIVLSDAIGNEFTEDIEFKVAHDQPAPPAQNNPGQFVTIPFDISFREAVDDYGYVDGSYVVDSIGMTSFSDLGTDYPWFDDYNPDSYTAYGQTNNANVDFAPIRSLLLISDATEVLFDISIVQNSAGLYDVKWKVVDYYFTVSDPADIPQDEADLLHLVEGVQFESVGMIDGNGDLLLSVEDVVLDWSRMRP